MLNVCCSNLHSWWLDSRTLYSNTALIYKGYILDHLKVNLRLYYLTYKVNVMISFMKSSLLHIHEDVPIIRLWACVYVNFWFGYWPLWYFSKSLFFHRHSWKKAKCNSPWSECFWVDFPRQLLVNALHIMSVIGQKVNIVTMQFDSSQISSWILVSLARLVSIKLERKCWDFPRGF